MVRRRKGFSAVWDARGGHQFRYILFNPFSWNFSVKGIVQRKLTGVESDINR
jgi:hypothetical protein